MTSPPPCDPHRYGYNIAGSLSCVDCGAEAPAPREFIAQPHDFARWGGHIREMFTILADGEWHQQDELVRRVGTKGFTGRISDLRRRGCVITCDRMNKGGMTRYRLTEVLSEPTLRPPTYHCPGCTCQR